MTKGLLLGIAIFIKANAAAAEINGEMPRTIRDYDDVMIRHTSKNPVTENERETARALLTNKLAKYGDKACPFLLEGIVDQKLHEMTRYTLLENLGGCPKDLVIPVLLATLGNQEQSFMVRDKAAFHLRSYPATRDHATPLLIQLVKDSSGTAGTLHLSSLNPGEAAAELVPLLIGTLVNKDQGVRQCAALLLGKIGPPAVSAIPTLIYILEHDPNGGVRAYVAGALGEMKDKAVSAVPALLRQFEMGRYFHERFPAAVALAKIDTVESRHVAVLLLDRLLRDKKTDGMARPKVIEELKRINTPAANQAIENYNRQLRKK